MVFSLSSAFPSFNKKSNTTPKKTVGIDIGSASVKVVEIEQTSAALMLRTYGELQLGPYAGKPLGESVSLDNKKKTEAVIDVIRESRVTANHGALAMPISASFMTVIPLTVKEGEDISSRIPVEARKFIPIPLNDVSLDWTELPQLNNVESNIREVLLAAIENKSLAEYKEVLSVIGMTSAPSEIEAFSLVRSLWKHTDSTLAVIDIGAKTSRLYIVRNGTLERIHRVANGGAQISRRVSELVGVTFEEAENLKRAYTKESENARDIHKAMASVLEGILQEFKRILNQYESRQGAPIGRVVFSGGVAASPFFLAYAKDTLGTEVEIGNPFSKVAYPAFMEDVLASVAPTFGVSLGAALRQFEYNS